MGEELDGRADIFAVGVILYEMCVGQRLFRGKPSEVRDRILSGDVPAPTFVDPDFPPALEAIIMRALEVDPNDRYSNCDHMYRELDTFMQEAGITATPRRISAFMNEMFGEGAPAEVNYDDQYDDLNDEALDFDQFDQLGANRDDEPDWAKSLESGRESGEDASPSPRRSMTIGNLEELVANMKKDQAEESGVRTHEESRGARDESRDTGRGGAREVAGRGGAGSSRAKPQPVPQPPDTGSQKASRKPRPSPRTGGRPMATTRHTISTGALEAGVTGSFGQGVVTEQTKRGNPLVWIAAIVIIGALLYFGYTILTAK
jgi:serine/threonine protein kinase